MRSNEHFVEIFCFNGGDAEKKVKEFFPEATVTWPDDNPFLKDELAVYDVGITVDYFDKLEEISKCIPKAFFGVLDMDSISLSLQIWHCGKCSILMRNINQIFTSQEVSNMLKEINSDID